MLKTDHGNETGVMATVHCLLRQNADVHRHEASAGNHRIENCWQNFCRTFST